MAKKQMPTKKTAKAPETAASPARFSLVPAAAQQQMYKTLAGLHSAQPDAEGAATVAEIAVCLARGERDPVIRAYPVGASLIRKAGKPAGRRALAGAGGRLTKATLSAIEALLGDSKATAVVCAGKLDAAEDYRRAFSFAARHKLPILFVVANTPAPGRGQVENLCKLTEELAIPVFSVDANDAIAAYRVATEALHNARHQRGPCIIEALTVNGKGGSAADPLELLRSYMERHGNWPL